MIKNIIKDWIYYVNSENQVCDLTILFNLSSKDSPINQKECLLKINTHSVISHVSFSNTNPNHILCAYDKKAYIYDIRFSKRDYSKIEHDSKVTGLDINNNLLLTIGNEDSHVRVTNYNENIDFFEKVPFQKGVEELKFINNKHNQDKGFITKTRMSNDLFIYNRKFEVCSVLKVRERTYSFMYYRNNDFEDKVVGLCSDNTVRFWKVGKGMRRKDYEDVGSYR